MSRESELPHYRGLEPPDEPLASLRGCATVAAGLAVAALGLCLLGWAAVALLR